MRQLHLHQMRMRCVCFAFLASCLLALLACVAIPNVAHAADSYSSVAMNRLYNPNSGEHFYTASDYERDFLRAAGWSYEGIGWYAPESSGMPVYRLYNPNAGDHHYTMSAVERDHLVAVGWNDEGIGWYSSESPDRLALLRQYNPNAIAGAHNFTLSQVENDHLVSVGWRAEGIAWFAVNRQPEPSDNANPYDAHGALSTRGTRVVDAHGDVFQVRGISTHGIAWFPQFVNETAFSTWKCWGANTVRLACYTAEYGGWCTDGNRDELLATIDRGVQAATSQGMYVIIDWHVLQDQNPLVHVDDAKEFFETVSSRYASYGNVIYEICNEPNGSTRWDQVYSYADQVIPVIRAHAPSALVICGTPTWSQDVDAAADRPLPYANVAYALHFYAGTHKDALRAKARAAIDAGLPLLVSEFGISDASGNGALDEVSGNQWISFLDNEGMGFVCWGLCNKDESSALLLSSTTSTGYWRDDELSQEGRWYKNALLTHAGGQTTVAPPDTSDTNDSDDTPRPNASLAITCDAGSSWTSGDRQHTQYNLTITNGGSGPTSGWIAYVDFDREVQVERSWNGDFVANGTSITVQPNADWQRAIAPGASVSLGFIVTSRAQLHVKTIRVEQQ